MSKPTPSTQKEQEAVMLAQSIGKKLPDGYKQRVLGRVRGLKKQRETISLADRLRQRSESAGKPLSAPSQTISQHKQKSRGRSS